MPSPTGPTLAGLPLLPASLAEAAAAHVLRYPFKVWGFGEDIALRALWDLGSMCAREDLRSFVADLLHRWCEPLPESRLTDHVAPGALLLELHRETGEGAYGEAAHRLAGLYRSFPEVGGVPVHRTDLPDWSGTIWVDCMAMDGPFLSRYAAASGDPAWHDLAAHYLRAYTSALRDPATGLFWHGYDVHTQEHSPCLWARGNGWALHGLVDTLEALPADHPARGELLAVLERLLAALISLQAEDGRWHTILDDPTSPRENSTAALFASAAFKACRLGLVSAWYELAAMLERSVRALTDNASPNGALPISSATPVGQRRTYVEQSLGTFPWGQGPLILTYTEGRRAAQAAKASSLPSGGSA